MWIHPNDAESKMEKVQSFQAQVSSESLLENFLRFALSNALLVNEVIHLKILGPTGDKKVPEYVPVELQERYDCLPIILVTGWHQGAKVGIRSLFGGTAPDISCDRGGSEVSINFAIDRIMFEIKAHKHDWSSSFLGKGIDEEDKNPNQASKLGYEICLCKSNPSEFAISLVNIFAGK